MVASANRIDLDVTDEVERPKRPLARSLWRGFRCRCPNCGKGSLFDGYLKVAPLCSVCGEDLSHHRADDAPPYFTMVVVGHVVVPLILLVETNWHLSNATHLAIWLPLTAALTLGLLRPIKGMVVGLQWALLMHGFDQTKLAEEASMGWAEPSQIRD